jgi:hypothetical protein
MLTQHREYGIALRLLLLSRPSAGLASSWYWTRSKRPHRKRWYRHLSIDQIVDDGEELTDTAHFAMSPNWEFAEDHNPLLPLSESRQDLDILTSSDRAMDTVWSEAGDTQCARTKRSSLLIFWWAPPMMEKLLHDVHITARISPWKSLSKNRLRRRRARVHGDSRFLTTENRCERPLASCLIFHDESDN